jgi:ATP-dependent Lon protease
MPELDRKVTEILAGKVVRKDLVRRIKVGVTVPVYVLEYLLGKYCATDDPTAIDAGLRVVHATLSENFVRPDEANKAQSVVREKGRHQLIDKVKVRYVSDDDKYWAELVNFGHKYVHVPEQYVRQYDRLLTGGVWAQMDLRHEFDEEAKGKRSPFWISDLKPIQMGSFDLAEYQEERRKFTTDEWIDVLLRSIGLEPRHFQRRLKLLFLARLIPLCETRFNLVELGPRSTGKSYGFQELSPYTILLTGATTVANLFYNMATGKMGLVGNWDAVAFDEVADLEKMPKEVVTMLKTYCESGTFARGKEALSGIASIAMFGNTNQPVDVMVRSSHLFAPMPDVIREDMAFLDRIHFYLPGWEVPKMRNEFFTDHYGFVVDYLAEALKELRRLNFAEALDRHFSLGSHLNARDAKAVRKTLSGLLKLVHPHQEYTRDELAELLTLAIRRPSPRQGAAQEAGLVRVPSDVVLVHRERDDGRALRWRSRGRGPADDLRRPPRSRFDLCVLGERRCQGGALPDRGWPVHGDGETEGCRRCRRCDAGFESNERLLTLQGHKQQFGISQLVDTTDFHVEAIDLLSNRISCEVGMALFVAIYSALQRRPALPGLVVLGDMSIQGNLKPVRSLAEPLQIAMENGAHRSLIPLANKRQLLEVAGEVVDRVDPIFYSDPLSGALKGLGMK